MHPLLQSPCYAAGGTQSSTTALHGTTELLHEDDNADDPSEQLGHNFAYSRTGSKPLSSAAAAAAAAATRPPARKADRTAGEMVAHSSSLIKSEFERIAQQLDSDLSRTTAEHAAAGSASARRATADDTDR
jgi:hypothetical protein